jgi:hypothetical protein
MSSPKFVVSSMPGGAKLRRHGLRHASTDDIAACRICADRFAATATAHAPAPGLLVSARRAGADRGAGARRAGPCLGRPFTDPSGDRLRDWMGIDEATFYDRDRVAILPMAFCFPGYDAKGSDLPPPPVCARRPGARRCWRTCRTCADAAVGGAMRSAGIWATRDGRHRRPWPPGATMRPRSFPCRTRPGAIPRG